MMEHFFWMTLPYIVLTVFTLGILYRYRTDKFGWTSKSSEFLEKNYLKWGSIFFHWGIFGVLGGHIVGLLIPIEWHHKFGISDEMYHAGALWGGGVVGIICFIGVFILALRRLFVKKVRKTSAISDIIVILLLNFIVFMGLFSTIFNGFHQPHFEYRTSIAPWIRGVLIFHADPSLMIDAPLSFKIHIVSAFLLFSLIPFSRLVHMFSFPVQYLWRSYVLYRKR